MSRERLSADEVIELGRERRSVPVHAIRGVFDAWTARLDGRLTELMAVEERLAQADPEAAFLGWAGRLAGPDPILGQASRGERWEAVRRTALELLGAAQTFVLGCGPYLSPEEEESLGMAMDRALAAIEQAEKQARPIRSGLRAAIDGMAQGIAGDLNTASAEISSLLPKKKGDR